MMLLTASTVLLSAVLCGLLVRTVHPDADWRATPHWVPLAMVAAPLVLICLFAYWGFSPIVEQRQRVAAVVERTLGLKAWAVETVADAERRKKTRAAASARFRLKVIATTVLLAVSVTIRSAMPRLPEWVPAAVFYGGMVLWELAFSRKARRECFAHASFWTLLFLTSFGADLIPSESVWKAVTPLVGLAALTFVIWRHAEAIPEQTVQSVMEAYNRGDYATALERADKMDPAFCDRHSQHRLRALIHYRSREFDAAEIQIRKGLLEQWDCRKASSLLSMLGAVLIEKMQFEEAETVLNGAAELNRLNGSVDRLGALLLLRQGIEPERALLLSQKALVSNEDEKALALSVRAWALAENGRQAEARTAIDHALGLPSARFKPDAAEVCYYAGRATFNRGASIIAERYFLGAVDAEPDGLFGALARTGLRKCQPALEQQSTWDQMPARGVESPESLPEESSLKALDSALDSALDAALDAAVGTPSVDEDALGEATVESRPA